MNAERKAILVPLDGSSFSNLALPWSIHVARRLGQSLTLARVLSPPYRFDAADEARETRHLEGLAIRVREQGVSCDVTVPVGDPAIELVEIARSKSVEFISLASHGRTGAERRAMGSVADHVVHHSVAPVFLQNKHCLTRGERDGFATGPILVPLDGSELAELALPDALRLARACGVSLLLVHADNPFPPIEGVLSLDSEIIDTIIDESEAYLRTIATWAQDEGVPAMVATGFAPPAAFIRDTAVTYGVSMIAMATHGRSGNGRLVLGSVADALIQTADVPILLIGHTVAASRRSPVRGDVVASLA